MSEQQYELGGSEDTSVTSGGGFREWISPIVIFGALVLGYVIYYNVLGSCANFQPPSESGVPCTNGHPVEGGVRHWLGLMFKGGPVVGTAIALFLITVILSIERFITMNIASGKGRLDVFVQKIQLKLENDDIDGALEECDQQRGSVGNVVKEALKKYKAAASDNTRDKEHRMNSIKKAIEEATSLEMPVLEKHLTIIATIVSIATLVGLIGTVIGMIKAFSALGASGQPDAQKLSIGISEALVNTVSGITTSTIATVAYNYFTSRIDDMTYRIDEAGISIVETFNEKF